MNPLIVAMIAGNPLPISIILVNILKNAVPPSTTPLKISALRVVVDYVLNEFLKTSIFPCADSVYASYFFNDSPDESVAICIYS